MRGQTRAGESPGAWSVRMWMERSAARAPVLTTPMVLTQSRREMSVMEGGSITAREGGTQEV